MKKLYFGLILFLLVLQSCSIDTTFTFHKDKTRSITMEVDGREFVELAKNLEKDSTKNKKNIFNNQISQEWTSVYDLEKKTSNKIPSHPDSIRIMKKLFLKGVFTDKNLTGLAMKIDKISDEDHHFFSNHTNNKDELSQKSLISMQDIYKWNGKKLIFYPKKWIPESDKNEKKKEKSLPFRINDILKAKIYLKFDTRIKSIRDRENLTQKVDEQTIVIDINTLKDKLKNKNPKIVISTE